MVTYRIERLNKEFLRLIAEILANDVKNEAARGAILTHVSCSRDLGHAKVYFTLLDESEKDEVLKALQEVKGTLRGRLGKMMRIRQIPDLHFLFDDSERKAREVDELIDRVIGGMREESGVHDKDAAERE